MVEFHQIAAALYLAAGVGAVQLDGRMVDRPVVERARRLIAAVTEG